MAEDAGEKTESPTPRRMNEARQKGQVARSQDLTAAALLFAGLVSMMAIGPNIWRGLTETMRLGLFADRLTRATDLPGLAAGMMFASFQDVAILMLVLFIVALVVLYFQVGPLLTLTPLTPKLEKLNPLSGIKRLFSARKVVELLQNIGKLVLVCGVSYITIAGVVDKVLFAPTVGFPDVYPMAWELVIKLGFRVALMMLILALFDFAYQRYRHTKDLKMTKQEVKEELKSMEGDPILKRRRHEVQMQLALQRIRKDVPQADVVITNPTHYSVALRYDPEKMSAPKVVAKGVDFLAMRIRELAAASGVPIVERPVLARGLYAEVEVGREVPGKFFAAIAEILAYVYELTGRKMRPQPLPVA